MPKFLPVLRGSRSSRVETKSVAPIGVAFSHYYNDLAAAGVRGSRGRDWSIDRAVTEGYERIIWVFKSVNTIGADSARLPFRLREGDEEVDDHPLYRVLNKKANPIETGQVFRKRLSAQVMLSKRGAFVECTLSNGGTIKRLDLLPPDRTEIVPGTGNDLISHFRLTRKDGTYKNLDPQTVRWFRDPHPLDPYMGTTPLESAGLSVELDHFARLYNVSFMQNDGRPGGVLAVRKTDGSPTGGDMDERNMNRIEQRFGKGPVEAGKLSVIAGQLDYVDLAARPRDMQYGATSRNAKIEILSAFGVPESVLGYSAERTFDNADNELYVYWTRTLPAHHEILLTGFDEDSEDTLEGFFDTSHVEVLERAERTKREEARTEVAAGLRSIWSYAKMAGIDDEIEETAHTRALYIANGRTPLPARAEDMEALGLGTVVDEGAAPGAAPGAPGSAAVTDGATPPGGAPQPAPDGPPALPAAAAPRAVGAGPAGSAAAVLSAITGKHLHAIEGGRPKARAGYRLASKAAAPVESTPNLAEADALEAALAAALSGLTVRWTERAVARIVSPKQRKHTRHWAAEYKSDTRVGTKALDAARAVDDATWRTEAEAAVEPLIRAAATSAAQSLLADFAVEPPPGLSLATVASRAVYGVVTAVTNMVGLSAQGAALNLIAAVNKADQDGETIDAITDLVRKQAGGLETWARAVSTRAATATVNAARNDAAREAVQTSPGADEVTRVWFSRRDSITRPSHAPATGADGQARGLDEPFIVGDALLRFPGDPLGPPGETYHCRCFLRHRMVRTGRWTSRKHLAGQHDQQSHGRSGPRIIYPWEKFTAATRGDAVRIADAVESAIWGEGAGPHIVRPPEAARVIGAAERYDRAVESGEMVRVNSSLVELVDAVAVVDRMTNSAGDRLLDAADDGVNELVHRLLGRSARVKALPRDGDRDGFVYDGTPRQRPAPRRAIDVPAGGHGRSIRDQARANVDWRRGYEQTWERMKGEPRDARERAARDLWEMQRATDTNTPNARLLSGALQALTDLHEGAAGIDTPLSAGDNVDVIQTAPRAAAPRLREANIAEEAARVPNPGVGKRVGEPRKVPQARSGTHIYETVGGRWEGRTVDRLLWRVEKRDGVWGVYPPTEQSPAYFSAGTKREAERWAMDRANGIPDPDDEPETPSAADATYGVTYRGLDEGEAMVTAKVDGEVIGALRWNFLEDPPVVVDMSVGEKYRRQGVGTRLFEEARKRESRLQHSATLTTDGAAFRASFRD